MIQASSQISYAFISFSINSVFIKSGDQSLGCVYNYYRIYFVRDGEVKLTPSEVKLVPWLTIFLYIEFHTAPHANYDLNLKSSYTPLVEVNQGDL